MVYRETHYHLLMYNGGSKMGPCRVAEAFQRIHIVNDIAEGSVSCWEIINVESTQGSKFTMADKTAGISQDTRYTRVMGEGINTPSWNASE